jgi:hypothetical protein
MIPRSGAPRAAASVAKPLRKECPATWAGPRPARRAARWTVRAIPWGLRRPGAIRPAGWRRRAAVVGRPLASSRGKGIPLAQCSESEPALQGQHRAGPGVATLGDADGASLACGVSLALPDQHVDALLDEAEVGGIEGAQLAAPHSRGKAEQEQGPVADREQVVLGGRLQHRPEAGRPDGGDLAGAGSPGAGQPGDGPPHRLGLGGGGEGGGAVGLGDDHQPPAQGGKRRPRVAAGGEVEGDGVSLGGQGREPEAPAPELEAGEVALR